MLQKEKVPLGFGRDPLSTLLGPNNQAGPSVTLAYVDSRGDSSLTKKEDPDDISPELKAPRPEPTAASGSALKVCHRNDASFPSISAIYTPYNLQKQVSVFVSLQSSLKVATAGAARASGCAHR